MHVLLLYLSLYIYIHIYISCATGPLSQQQARLGGARRLGGDLLGDWAEICREIRRRSVGRLGGDLLLLPPYYLVLTTYYQVGGDRAPFIGILDVFGFESFATNGLELLLV